MKIRLVNQLRSAEIKEVIVDINKNFCEIDNAKNCSLLQLKKLANFSHFLLEDVNPQMVYEYQNTKQMLEVGIFIYKQILNTAGRVFTIKPAKNFKFNNNPSYINFSLRYTRAAAASIPLNDFEKLAAYFGRPNFKYSNNILINCTIDSANLPVFVDSEHLLKQDATILSLLSLPLDFEVRYIHPHMGLGIFATRKINRGENIGVYCGELDQQRLGVAYLYNLDEDCLNLDISAWRSGNLTGFINHADEVMPEKFLCANLQVNSAIYNGLEFKYFTAKKDINIGAQLLVNYGQEYFEPGINKIHFYSNSQLNIEHDNKLKMQHYNYMADNCNIKEAQTYLFILKLSKFGITVAILYLILFLFFK